MRGPPAQQPALARRPHPASSRAAAAQQPCRRRSAAAAAVTGAALEVATDASTPTPPAVAPTQRRQGHGNTSKNRRAISGLVDGLHPHTVAGAPPQAHTTGGHRRAAAPLGRPLLGHGGTLHSTSTLLTTADDGRAVDGGGHVAAATAAVGPVPLALGWLHPTKRTALQLQLHLELPHGHAAAPIFMVGSGGVGGVGRVAAVVVAVGRRVRAGTGREGETGRGNDLGEEARRTSRV